MSGDEGDATDADGRLQEQRQALQAAAEAWEQGHSVVLYRVMAHFGLAQEGKPPAVTLREARRRLCANLRRCDPGFSDAYYVPWKVGAVPLGRCGDNADAELENVLKLHVLKLPPETAPDMLHPMQEHAAEVRAWFKQYQGEQKGKRLPGNRRRRWSVKDAESFVRSLLLCAQKDGRTLSVRKIEAETGIPKSTVQETDAWKSLGSDPRKHIIIDTEWAENKAAN